jgi:spore coat polysaccharide biosynthesis predicted glycosyltransferase SpsG
MTRNRILFRADASHAIGFGHVARTAALIEEVATRGDEPLALFGGDDSLRSWVRDRGIPAEVKDWSPTDLLHATEDPRVRAVVIDGPQLAVDLLPKLADHHVPTILLDDAGHVPCSVTAVVNHNVHAPQLAASYPPASRRLLGRRYLLLRRDIRRYMRGSCRPLHGAARLRVVITFGGSDPVGATARTLALLPPDRPLELVVIAGPGFRDEDALQLAAATARDAGHIVDIRRAPDDPGALFVSADAAITSAGGTLGELAYLGCPALAFAIVPDQVAPARAQVRNGLIASGRTWADADDDTLRGDLFSFLMNDAERADQRQRALATADAEGPRRVIDEALS